MLKRLVVLSVLIFGSTVISRADSIDGFFSATGTDTFTSNTITFNSAEVAGLIGGTFATYLSDGDAIIFLPGPLPYNQGPNTPPANLFPSGSVPLFTVTGNGTTFTFNMTSYNAAYVTDATMGCTSGGTCLDVTGTGFFTSTGALVGTSGDATFLFTSQYVPGQPAASLTTFSASTSASPIPEPASLALMGSGLLGFVGFARRKMAV